MGESCQFKNLTEARIPTNDDLRSNRLLNKPFLDLECHSCPDFHRDKLQQESSLFKPFYTPAFAGVTVKGYFPASW